MGVAVGHRLVREHLCSEGRLGHRPGGSEGVRCTDSWRGHMQGRELLVDPRKKRGRSYPELGDFQRLRIKKQFENTFFVVLTDSSQAVDGHFLIFRNLCNVGPGQLSLHGTLGPLTGMILLRGELTFCLPDYSLFGRLHEIKGCIWRPLTPLILL